MKTLKRIRDWMEIPGRFSPAARNAITDVPGVTVGHCTIVEEPDVHTGVTIIKPHAGDPYRMPVPCAVYRGNGYGKLTGSMQVDELGECESLIGLTNTLSVCQVVQGILNEQVPRMQPGDGSMNVLVGETNDGFLSDLRGFHVAPEHVAEAIISLSADVPEGAVGAGAGTQCYGYKGGIGTASRVVPGSCIGEKRDYVVGALLQTNFGGSLNVYGRQLPYKPLPEKEIKGSCMIVVATDAPMDARQLGRLAKRGVVGMCDSGSVMTHGSGDFCIAFSNYPGNLTERNGRRAHAFTVLGDDQLTPFFEAVAEAAREAVYNSLTMSPDVTGYQGHTAKGFDIEQYRELIPLR